jgi:hypothetical protein
LRVLGITPYPRGWEVDAGPAGSSRFLACYREACAFLAADLAPFVDTWQVSNELNLAYFRRPFQTEEECVPFLVAGGLGVRDGNPRALLGVNMATGHEPSAARMYRQLYPHPDIAWDYVGVDAYYGTWEPGGPDTWVEKLDWVRGLTGHVPHRLPDGRVSELTGCFAPGLKDPLKGLPRRSADSRQSSGQGSRAG